MSKNHLQKKTQITDDDDLITSIYDFQPTDQDLYLYFAANTQAENREIDNYRIVISQNFYEPPIPGTNPNSNSPFGSDWTWEVYTIPAGTSDIENLKNKIVAKIQTIYEYRFDYTSKADGNVNLSYLCDHVDHLDDIGFGTEI